MKLKRRKVEASNYELVDEQGNLIAHVIRTGEYGRDDYPWDWYLADDVEFDVDKDSTGHRPRSQGNSDNMRDAVDYIETCISQYGIRHTSAYPPADQTESQGSIQVVLRESANEGDFISAYDVRRGDRFTVFGEQYTAVADAQGEFSPSIRVASNASPTGEDTIMLAHGSKVALVRKATGR